MSAGGRAVPVIGAEAILAAVPAPLAIERTRSAFERHARGEWEMPAKVYLDSPPGDFRAMPARGDGIALLKWVTSYPDNPQRDLPVVTGVIVLSDAETGEELAILDARSVTWLRTGAAAAVSAAALAAPGGSVGVIGCGVNGAWAARCLAAAGFGPGICNDPAQARAEELAAELGWQAGAREQAAGSAVVVTCTPATQPVLLDGELEPAQHLVALGADSASKSEIEEAALRHCRLFCDEWEQSSRGGELSGAVVSGAVQRRDVTELGAVLIGAAEGRSSGEEITLFDSTGLAIQDLGIATAVLDAWRAGEIEAPLADLG